jgi:AraC-like DNA-binding protein
VEYQRFHRLEGALTVLYRCVPPAGLGDFVEAFYLQEGNVLSHTRERRLPDGSMDLVINLGNDTLRVDERQQSGQFQSFQGGVLSGTHSQFLVIDVSNLVLTLSVHFKPGGAFPFLPLPAAELSNAVVSLETLWGASARDLREQLLAADNPAARFAILSQFLLARLARPREPHPAVSFALAAFQVGRARPSISEVSERLGLDPKRFIRLFHEEVGLTPKRFCRVIRFQEVLRLIEQGQPIEWADLALDCGYFDQAHFIHDFQGFCGLTPQAYLAQRSAYRNHVPLPD